MSGRFPTHFLYFDGSASSKLAKGSLPLSTDAPAGGEQIYLAGGFSILFQDQSFPLSPTLQLNCDCSSFSQEQLLKIARAELERYNRASFSSYLSEQDNRLAVISKQSVSLQAFCDTYGGLLEVTPLLLDASHPDFTNLIEANVTEGKEGCQINFTSRSPVDIRNCTYCGDCIAACPESCISETLFIDFNKCSFCRECEGVCRNNLIDIHGATNGSLEVPAVLLLGDSNGLELPDESNCIYSEKQLKEYLGTLHPYQVDEVVSWDGTTCQYSARFDGGCDSCLRACPSGAISRGEKGIELDHLACIDCGGCIDACPTGSLQYERFNDRAFIEYFRSSPLTPGTRVVIGSEKDLHQLWWTNRVVHDNTFFLEIPAPQGVSLMHILFLFAQGAGEVIFLEREPVSEQRNKGMARVISTANELVSGLFGEEGRVSQLSVDELPKHGEAGASSPLKQFYKDHSYINRRKKLASILQHLVAESGKQLEFSEGIPDFGDMAFDKAACTECLACLNECRLEALTSRPESLSLHYNAANCTQCGLCVSVCPENAIQLLDGFVLNGEYFRDRELTRAEAMTCDECGKVFGTRKSFDRVVALLAEQGRDDSIYRYCETCRVEKIFAEYHE